MANISKIKLPSSETIYNVVDSNAIHVPENPVAGDAMVYDGTSWAKQSGYGYTPTEPILRFNETITFEHEEGAEEATFQNVAIGTPFLQANKRYTVIIDGVEYSNQIAIEENDEFEKAIYIENENWMFSITTGSSMPSCYVYSIQLSYSEGMSLTKTIQVCEETEWNRFDENITFVHEEGDEWVYYENAVIGTPFLQDGKIYKIIIDGVEYTNQKCERYNSDLGDMTYIGIFLFLSLSSGIKDFSVACLVDPRDPTKYTLIILLPYSEGMSLTKSIQIYETHEVVQIDKKYIPSEIEYIKIIENDEGELISNKTSAEIYQLVTSGKTCIAVLNDGDYVNNATLQYCAENEAFFVLTDDDAYSFIINDEGNVSQESANFLTNPGGGTVGQVLMINENEGIEWSTIDMSSKEDISNKTTTLSSTSTDIQYPSAKAVYDCDVNLQTQINNLKNIGRFLAIWDASTGLPTSYPTPTAYPYTYTYKTGDYYRVGTVGTTVPSGTAITKESAAAAWVIPTVSTTETLTVGDVYYFDGTSWLRQASSGGGTVQDVQVDGVSVLNEGIANITGKENTSNKVTSISSSSTDTQYPSAKAVYDSIPNVPIKGVQVVGTDLTPDANGKVNIPAAAMGGSYGVVKINEVASTNGLQIVNNELAIAAADDSNISQRTGSGKPITSTVLDKAVKAAMCDGNGAAWTDIEKEAARSRMSAAGTVSPSFSGIPTAPTAESGTNNTQIATTAFVQGAVSTKQDTLVSGSNIKTINNSSILGSGNIDIDTHPYIIGEYGELDIDSIIQAATNNKPIYITKTETNDRNTNVIIFKLDQYNKLVVQQSWTLITYWNFSFVSINTPASGYYFSISYRENGSVTWGDIQKYKIAPQDRTLEMTVPVGIDADGTLWAQQSNSNVVYYGPIEPKGYNSIWCKCEPFAVLDSFNIPTNATSLSLVERGLI